MKDLWNWLEGKKTVIGAVLTLIVGFTQARGYLDADVATLLLSITGLIIGVGVTHKVVK